MSGHTKGPWTFEKYMREEALMTFGGTLDNLDFSYSVWLALKEQDARLISAAPELLEALQHTVAILRYEGVSNTALSALEQADAAIAKATGGSHA